VPQLEMVRQAFIEHASPLDSKSWEWSSWWVLWLSQDCLLGRLDDECIAMTTRPRFQKAFPYQRDVLALPVTDLDAASRWYGAHFGMAEVERREEPVPTVILERDGTRLGFAINGEDASQDGAAVLVSDIQAVKDQLEKNGTAIGNWRIDERNGVKYQVFFVVAPDGLCFYFHEPVSE
jgi:catechol 2,3-dioxygenase-like lactoylglutathione lyase family enzyme